MADDCSFADAGAREKVCVSVRLRWVGADHPAVSIVIAVEDSLLRRHLQVSAGTSAPGVSQSSSSSSSRGRQLQSHVSSTATDSTQSIDRSIDRSVDQSINQCQS